MKFISLTFSFLILLLISWIGLNIWRIGSGFESPISNSCKTIDMKREISRQTASPKLAVIGASNVLFGVRTQLMSKELGTPTINVGLPASLGIDIILATAKSILKPGDTALLTIELFFFTDLNIDGPFIQEALFQCDTDAFFDISLHDQARSILLQSISNLARGVGARAKRDLTDVISGAPLATSSLRPDFDSSGDYIENDARRVTPEQRKFVSDFPGGTTLQFSVNSPGVRAIRRFVAWAHENQVKVVATWPAVYWPQRDLARPGLQQIKAFYESLGIPVVGEPTDGMLPLDHFFDTNNHLTAEAAIGRTELLIRQLRPTLQIAPRAAGG